MQPLLTPSEYGYVQHENIVLFQKGPLSQWYGAYQNQVGGFSPDIDGKSLWYCNCAEQWMMAAKAALFNDEESFYDIMRESNPKEQKNLGRKVKNFDPDVWEKEKYNIVLAGNKWKFKQNQHLQKFICQFARDTVFAEAAPWDTIWGIGLGPTDADALDPTKWRGENLLGKVLTHVRNIFQ